MLGYKRTQSKYQKTLALSARAGNCDSRYSIVRYSATELNYITNLIAIRCILKPCQKKINKKE